MSGYANWYSWLTNSAVGTVVKDTVVSAAVGAVVGGAVSAATGGKFEDGAKRGAVVGGVAGAVSSSYNQYQSHYNPNTTLAAQDNAAAGAIDATLATEGVVQQSVAPHQPESKGLLSSIKNMDTADKELLGNTLATGAQAYMSDLDRKAREKEAARQEAIQLERMDREDDRFYVRWTEAPDWKHDFMQNRQG